MIMMIGASRNRAKEKAMPYAARLNLGLAIRAMIAAKKGPSIAIISQVAAKGAQKMNIFFWLSGCFCTMVKFIFSLLKKQDQGDQILCYPINVYEPFLKYPPGRASLPPIFRI